MDKKKKFNRIHNQYLLKQHKLNELLQIYEMYKAEDIDFSPMNVTHMQNLYDYRRNEHEEIMQALNNEMYYQDVLENMHYVRRKEKTIFFKPIDELKANIKIMDAHISRSETALSRDKSMTSIFQIRIEELKNKLNTVKVERKMMIDSDLKIYEEKQRFWHCLEHEKVKNTSLSRNKRQAKKLLKEEKKLANIKSAEVFDKLMNRVEEKQNNEELKFREIQKVANITKAQDMYPYYLYLTENQHKLQKAVNNSAIKIESLQLERDMLKEELQRLNTTTQPHFISNTEIEELEIELLHKEKHNEDINRVTGQLIDLISSNLNVVSRLTYQLFDKSEKHILNKKNIIPFLANCEVLLEKMLEMILGKNMLFIDESINTVDFI